jgi:RND family efflux transporter MFP subunit
MAFGLAVSGCGQKPAQQAAGGVKKIPVRVETVKKDTLKKTINLGGLLQPQDQVYLSAKNPSLRVLRVPVRVGDEVAAGTPLVVFDSREIDLQLEQARLNYERNQQLYEAGAVSKSQFEQVKFTYENLLLQKEAAVISSPFAGTVASVEAVEGQLAGAGSLVSVVNSDKLKLQVQVGEANIGRLKKGGEMTVAVPAAGGEYRGLITSIAPQADSRTRAYPVTLEITNEDKALKGGMYGEVQLVVETREDVVVVPQQAILDQGAKKVVYVVENGQARMKEVRVGLTLGDRAEIIEGLQAGEALVVEGQYGLKDGSPVSAETGSERR